MQILFFRPTASTLAKVDDHSEPVNEPIMDVKDECDRQQERIQIGDKALESIDK